MKYTAKQWVAGDMVTSSALNNIEAGIETAAGEMSSYDATAQVLAERLNVLEAKVKALKQTNISIEDPATATSISKKDSDLVISSTTPVTATTNVVGKSIDVQAMTVTSAHLAMKAAGGDLDMTGVTTSGNLDKSVSNSGFSLESNEYVTIKGSDFQQSGYNAIEIGLNGTAPKGILIDGVNFGTLTNNAISIFATAENAVITIKNATIASVSNFVRISNRTNVKNVTLNLIDCDVNSVETGEYCGIVLMQDYTATTEAQAISDNRFGPDKLTINFTNCKLNGKLVSAEDPAAICGTKDINQICYVYRDRGGIVAYDAAYYPVVNVK